MVSELTPGNERFDGETAVKSCRQSGCRTRRSSRPRARYAHPATAERSRWAADMEIAGMAQTVELAAQVDWADLAEGEVRMIPIYIVLKGEVSFGTVQQPARAAAPEHPRVARFIARRLCPATRRVRWIE